MDDFVHNICFFAVLQETRLPGSGSVIKEKRYTFYWSGVRTKAAGGRYSRRRFCNSNKLPEHASTIKRVSQNKS